MASNKGSETLSVVTPEPELYSHTGFKTAKRDGAALNIGNSETISEDAIGRETALTALTTDQEKKLIRRVDWRLMPLLCMLYLVKKLDESNVSLPLLTTKRISFSHRLDFQCADHEQGHG